MKIVAFNSRIIKYPSVVERVDEGKLRAEGQNTMDKERKYIKW